MKMTYLCSPKGEEEIIGTSKANHTTPKDTCPTDLNTSSAYNVEDITGAARTQYLPYNML